MATTYWDYIRVEDILGLQGGIENDESKLTDSEVLFITVHQVYELWFKLVLRELSALRACFKHDPVPEDSLSEAAERLERATTIMKMCAQHFEVVETLNTHDYLVFRDKLFPASGFQSAQLREMEILLGLPEEDRIGMGSAKGYKQALGTLDGSDSPALKRVQARLEDPPTLRDAIESWLARTPIRGSSPGDEGDEAVVDGFLADYLERYEAALARLQAEVRATLGEDGDAPAFEAQMTRELASVRAFCEGDSATQKRVRAALLFIEGYKRRPLLAWPRRILDRIVAFEQAFVIFRQRHARMVERVIGRRTGTGGSAGVDYLDQTALSYRIFKDLWTVRTILIPRADMPPLPERENYGFAAE